MLWECTSQSFDRKLMTYPIGLFEKSFIKQLFTKVWTRIGKSTGNGAVSWGWQQWKAMTNPGLKGTKMEMEKCGQNQERELSG